MTIPKADLKGMTDVELMAYAAQQQAIGKEVNLKQLVVDRAEAAKKAVDVAWDRFCERPLWLTPLWTSSSLPLPGQLRMATKYSRFLSRVVSVRSWWVSSASSSIGCNSRSTRLTTKSCRS
ncbi:hypothetical protein ACFL6C_01490 [Myxococcota bacterium]